MNKLEQNTTSLNEVLTKINNLPNKPSEVEQATPTIAVSSGGLITASATQTAGYVSAGTKSATKQLTIQAAKTITPSALDQVAISSGVYATGAVTVKGDANLVAENIISGKSIFGVSGTAESGGGGNTDIEDAMVTGTLTEYTNDRVTSIGDYAFAYCFKLTSVNFPVCISVNKSAFYNCSRLTSVNFPACTSIGSSAFGDCGQLTSINFPVCTNIKNYAFAYCNKLTSANFPACTSIDYSAFTYCSKLTSVNFPVCTYIYGYAFNKCYTLSSVTLGASIVCTLANSNVFSSTPYAGYSKYFSGTPHIYVPASLLTAYQSATNWAYFSSRFSTIESLG